MTSPRVVVVGADGPAAELVASFQRLGAEVTVLDAGVDPAEVIERVRPDHVMRTVDPADVDREGLRRLAADELGLPTAPFWFAGSVAELTAITDHTGFPLVVKPLAALPGEGQSVLLRPDDIEPAWQRARTTGGPDRVLVETVVEIDHEITLLTVRGADGGPDILRGHRPPTGRLRPDGRKRHRARGLAAPADESDRRRCRPVHRGEGRQRARWPGRVRRRTAGPR